MNRVRLAPDFVRTTARLTCREFVDFLDEYIAGSLGAEENAVFRRHLSRCPACVRYLAGYAANIRFSHAALHAGDNPLPDNVPEELVLAILAARGSG